MMKRGRHPCGGACLVDILTKQAPPPLEDILAGPILNQLEIMMAHSRRDSVTAFDAKTHLSSLIRDVEQRNSFTITQRGKPVARLEPVSKPTHETVDALLTAFRDIRQRATGEESIRELINEDRKR